MTTATLMSEADRRRELTDLARNWQGYGGTVRCLRLIDLVDGELLKDPRLADFWDTFLGEVALMTGEMTQTVRLNAGGETKTVRAFGTQVWAMRGGGWRQVLYQATEILPYR